MQFTSKGPVFPPDLPSWPAARSGPAAAAPFLSKSRPDRCEQIIRLPTLGLTVRMRFPHSQLTPLTTVIETTNAAGLGPPLHRRAQTEIFEILTGRFLFEVDGERFIARRGDLVRVPGGASRAFVNVTGTGARQQIFIEPGFDAVTFFLEVEALLRERGAGPDRLRRFVHRWGVEVLGPPLQVPVDDGEWRRTDVRP